MRKAPPPPFAAPAFRGPPLAVPERRPVPTVGNMRDQVPGSRHDRYWRRERWTAVCWAVAVPAVLLGADAATGGLRLWRVVLWCALSPLVLAVLLPARVTERRGWLRSRGLLREDRVCLERLRAVRWSGAVAARLVLLDADGGRVEIDTRVLCSDPLLWHRIETAARRGGVGAGDRATLRTVADAVDGAALRGLEPGAVAPVPPSADRPGTGPGNGGANRPPAPRSGLRSAAPRRSRGVRRRRR